MERNWYVVCTKQQHEKKVTELLTKKGIESYCPFTHVKRKNGTQSVTTNLPLFRSYVFVKATKDEIVSVKKTPSIINTVYWKSEPVVLQQEEITAIKLMAENYLSIKLERTEVCLSGQIGIVEENITGHKHNILTIKPLSLDITIPSLGYRMVGQRTNIKKSTIARKPSVVSTIAKRLNPALLFGL